MAQTKKLPVFGITFTGNTVTSDLKDPAAGPEYNAAVDAIEALVLAHYLAGVDVGTPAYLEGIETAVGGISNPSGDGAPVTFASFQASRRWSEDLSEVDPNTEGAMGYIYLQSFFIEVLPSGQLHIPIGNAEYVLDTLPDAEWVLWDEFVRAEVAPAE